MLSGITTAGYRALALVDGRRQHQLIEVAKAVDDVPAIEVDGDLACFRIDARYDAQVAVVDLPAVIVLDLHDLVAWTEGPAEQPSPDVLEGFSTI